MIFILFLIFLLWFTYERTKVNRIEKRDKDIFWERENTSNNTRKKNLDTLEYITIPDDIFPDKIIERISISDRDSVLNDNEIERCASILKDLQEKRILNLTGKTTTELKFEYGPANLSMLDEYDTNFTLFAQTIYAYGDALHRLNLDNEAIRVLRFGIDSLSDISGNYKLLATLYAKYGQVEKIDELKKIAGGLDSLMKNAILRALDDIASSS